jgi:hypothetical protein
MTPLIVEANRLALDLRADLAMLGKTSSAIGVMRVFDPMGRTKRVPLRCFFRSK